MDTNQKYGDSEKFLLRQNVEFFQGYGFIFLES